VLRCSRGGSHALGSEADDPASYGLRVPVIRSRMCRVKSLPWPLMMFPCIPSMKDSASGSFRSRVPSSLMIADSLKALDRSGLLAVVDPFPERRHAIRRPGVVTRHPACLQRGQDAVGVVPDVLEAMQVEGPKHEHRLTVGPFTE
jgi:hypothetical protein